METSAPSTPTAVDGVLATPAASSTYIFTIVGFSDSV